MAARPEAVTAVEDNADTKRRRCPFPELVTVVEEEAEMVWVSAAARRISAVPIHALEVPDVAVLVPVAPETVRASVAAERVTPRAAFEASASKRSVIPPGGVNAVFPAPEAKKHSSTDFCLAAETVGATTEVDAVFDTVAAWAETGVVVERLR